MTLALLVALGWAFLLFPGDSPASDLPERTVLDGHIFQGTSSYQANTNDDLVRNVVRKVDAVILGKVESEENEFTGRRVVRTRLSVIVLEAYKGKLQAGDKIFVSIYWGEGGPADLAEMIGKKAFYFLTPRELNQSSGPTIYESRLYDIASWDRYGEPMRKILRTVPQREEAWLDTLLAPSGSIGLALPYTANLNWEKWQRNPAASEVANPEANALAPLVGYVGGSSHSLLRLRWVSRAELVARKSFWQRCASGQTIPPGQVTYGEMYESFNFQESGACEYLQGVPQSQGKLEQRFGSRPRPSQRMTEDDLAAPNERSVWMRMERPDTAAFLYKAFTSLADQAQSVPAETSWCVILGYLDGGKVRLRHFYVASRLEIQDLLDQAKENGKDCSEWPYNDKRFQAIPDWVSRDLKYDPKTN